MADDQLSPSYSTDNGCFSADSVSCRPTRSVTIISDSMSFSDRHTALSAEIERHGSSELRHRQNDWQHSVQRMRSGFLKLLPADSESTSMTWKSAATINILDVHKVRTDNFEYPDDNADDEGCNDSITAAAASAIDDDDFDDVSESTRSSYKPRGRGRYQLRFDVADMVASSVRVTVESDVIVVRANRKSSTSTTYVRRVVKPEPVDRSKLRAFLSADGILTVEAPLSPAAADDYFASCRLRDHNGTVQEGLSNVHIKGMESSRETAMNGLVSGLQDGGWTDASMDNGTADKIGNLLTVDAAAAAAAAAAGTHPRSASRQSHCSSKDGGSGKGAAAKTGSSGGQGTGGGAGTDSPGAGSGGAGGAGGDGGAGKEKIGVPIFRDENGTRRMHLAVDLGSMYRPRDVIIQVIKENRIQIRAKHLEKAGERQSKNKFTKEYELGEKIETFSLQGGLTANGKLIVCAYAKGHGPVNDE